MMDFEKNDTELHWFREAYIKALDEEYYKNEMEIKRRSRALVEYVNLHKDELPIYEPPTQEVYWLEP